MVKFFYEDNNIINHCLPSEEKKDRTS